MKVLSDPNPNPDWPEVISKLLAPKYKLLEVFWLFARAEIIFLSSIPIILLSLSISPVLTDTFTRLRCWRLSQYLSLAAFALDVFFTGFRFILVCRKAALCSVNFIQSSYHCINKDASFEPRTPLSLSVWRSHKAAVRTSAPECAFAKGQGDEGNTLEHARLQTWISPLL